MTMMIDAQSPDTLVLRAALDRFNVGVAIVSHDSNIVHVNDAARSMLAEGRNILNRHGRLCATNRTATNELWRAIGLTCGSPPTITATGIGVPLPSPQGDMATAQVLPLARAGTGERPASATTAAVFIVRADHQAEPDLTAIAQSYRLTGADYACSSACSWERR